MNPAVIVLIVIAVLLLVLRFALAGKRRNRSDIPFPVHYRSLLEQHVDFYNSLSEEKKISFETRIRSFLATTRITGIKTEVEDLDRVLIAASAIIPIFGFENWEYINLNEVLLYPDAFNDSFDMEGTEHDTLGIIGTGPFQNIMILSKHALREGFSDRSGNSNPAIHEFVHLLDKTDGAVDGIPEFLLSRQYILPWLNLMQREIRQIISNRSDINPYGATDQSEFFAVVAEYFFERPDLLQEKHPELYKLLSQIFRQKP